MLRTGSLAVDGADVGGAAGHARLRSGPLEEVVGATVGVVVGVGARGHGRNGGGSEKALHIELKLLSGAKRGF